jgi:hypothetical protein
VLTEFTVLTGLTADVVDLVNPHRAGTVPEFLANPHRAGTVPEFLAKQNYLLFGSVLRKIPGLDAKED